MNGSTVTGSKVGITVVVMCAAVMAMLDISIVNVALSDIRASFGTPLDQIGWVSTGYMMANIVVIPMTGWFQRRFGFKKYFTASILIFTAASALCGMAWSLPSLVLFRVLQGMGGGAIIPTAQSLLFARYPQKEHGMAAGLFGIGAVTGPLLGPTVGGYLIEASTWHWIFLVNVPVGIVAAVLAWRFIEEPGFKAPKEKIDVFGIALLAVGMATLQYVLEEGNRDGWFESRLITLLATVSSISLVTFVVHELETDNPVVDLRVFKNRSYTAGTGINFLLGLALFSGAYLFSLYCGAVMHYRALDIGRMFMVAGALQIFLMPVVGRLSAKVDGRKLLLLGISVTTYSLWMNTHLTDQVGFWDLTIPQIIRSCGMAFIFIPISVLTLSDLSPEKRGNATGLFNLTRELGGSIGTAWMGMLVDDGTKIHAAQLSEHVSAYSPYTQERIGALQGGVGSMTSTPALVPESILSMKVHGQAMAMSFTDGFAKASAVFALGLLLIVFLKRPTPGLRIEGAH